MLGLSLSQKEGTLAHARYCARTALSIAATAFLLAACTTQQFGGGAPLPQSDAPTTANASVGDGQVRVALILPLSAQGNAGVAAQSMKNAAEMALRSEEHTSELQSLRHLVCRLLLEKKKHK